ncbi:MAG: aliphatic sulfonate ABC transporter substrate-binding protein [Actinomycetota bacterium]
MSKSPKHQNRLRASIAAAAVALFALTGCAAGEGPAEPSADPTSGETQQVLRVDFAYWNPLSLVIKDQGWLEAAVKDQGYTVEWIQSAGSSKAIENLNAEAIDIGSSAGAAAFAARANGVALTTVGVFSQPNWASIVVGKDSKITKVSELKGKKIAAASGTDPYFFLLQALAEAGLSSADVEIVNLIHADGQKALESGDVDAWAGLDPLTATSERTAGSKIIYSNPTFNSWGVLSATDKFLAEKPELVEIVLQQYQLARQWILDNPDQAVEILARDAQLDPADAAKVLLDRTNVNVSLIPGATQLAVWTTVSKVLVAEGAIKSQEAADDALATIINDSIAKKIG